MFRRSKPYLIVGLGNPGREYRGNRHNVGFMVLDQLAKRLETSFSRMRMNALMTAIRYGDERLILIKPQTYMNLSGQAVSSFLRFYKLPREHTLVVYDDVDLPFEVIRMKPNGGDAGQKGVRSIIEKLGTQEFPRLRVGVGRPPGRTPVSAYVLNDFSSKERELLPLILDQAASAVLHYIDNGLEAAMTLYNQQPDR